METFYDYLTDSEARAERAFRQAYCVEYTRLYERQAVSDADRLAFISQLALRAGQVARERVLQAELAAEAELAQVGSDE